MYYPYSSTQNTQMQRVTVDDIQRDPLKYLNQVEAGESFLIVQADKPIAELKPITTTNKQQHPFD